jgi:hypothetical protein
LEESLQLIGDRRSLQRLQSHRHFAFSSVTKMLVSIYKYFIFYIFIGATETGTSVVVVVVVVGVVVVKQLS